MIYFTFLLWLKIIVVFFVGSKISLHATTESVIILLKYSSFSQAHVLVFQI